MMVLQGVTEERKEEVQLVPPCPPHPTPALCPDLQKVSSLVLHCTEIRPCGMLPFLAPISRQRPLLLSSSRESESSHFKEGGTIKGSGTKATRKQPVLGGR